MLFTRKDLFSTEPHIKLTLNYNQFLRVNDQNEVQHTLDFKPEDIDTYNTIFYRVKILKSAVCGRPRRSCLQRAARSTSPASRHAARSNTLRLLPTRRQRSLTPGSPSRHTSDYLDMKLLLVFLLFIDLCMMDRNDEV